MARSPQAHSSARSDALLPACLLMIYLGSTIFPIADGRWLDGLAFGLGGAGFLVTTLTAYAAQWRTLDDDGRHKIGVLQWQSLAAYAMASVISVIWPTPSGPPLALTLAAVVTATMAAEAVRLYLRGTPAT